MKTEIKDTITRDIRIELNQHDLMEFIQSKIPDTLLDHKYDYRAYVRVPGGGDYSNCDLTIGQDVNVHVVIVAMRVKE